MIYWNWGRRDGGFEGEERFVQLVEGYQFFIQSSRGGGCGDGFGGGIHADWELSEGFEFLHGGVWGVGFG